MPKFRKRQIILEADQFNPDEKPWPEGVFCSREYNHANYAIKSGGRVCRISAGDYIITEDDGRKHPCSQGMFDYLYEPLDS